MDSEINFIEVFFTFQILIQISLVMFVLKL